MSLINAAVRGHINMYTHMYIYCPRTDAAVRGHGTKCWFRRMNSDFSTWWTVYITISQHNSMFKVLISMMNEHHIATVLVLIRNLYAHKHEIYSQVYKLSTK